jgi:hypothetical protein
MTLDVIERNSSNDGIDLFRIVPKWSLDGVTHRGLVPAVRCNRHEACASHLRATLLSLLNDDIYLKM